jgi:hypothetical protein
MLKLQHVIKADKMACWRAIAVVVCVMHPCEAFVPRVLLRSYSCVPAIPSHGSGSAFCVFFRAHSLPLVSSSRGQGKGGVVQQHRRGRGGDVNALQTSRILAVPEVRMSADDETSDSKLPPVCVLFLLCSNYDMYAHRHKQTHRHTDTQTQTRARTHTHTRTRTHTHTHTHTRTHTRVHHTHKITYIHMFHWQESTPEK